MVTFKRVKDDIWQSTSDDPQELAEANAIFCGGRPDPECFLKNGEKDLFVGVVHLPQFDTLPWDEIILRKK